MHSKVIGITGTIGSGKSTIGKILTDHSIPVIDTDHIVHELLSTDTQVRRAVIERFGPAIMHSDKVGSVDRTKLAGIVFQNIRAKQDLESIVHPAVIAEYRRQSKELARYPVVAVLVPLLFEAGIASEFDEVWTVLTAEDVLRQRLKSRENLSSIEIDKRLAAQWPQEQKASRSHRIIDNSGSLEETRHQVEVLLKMAQET
ncbi:MAG: dephospho-CoA kinase [Candidatus Melainabacteria bacterium]|nr:dephospho-CoA kinase [Candidatus Melainabacteria bacterium]